MSLLREDPINRDQVRRRMLTVISELDGVDSEQALEMSKWMLQKAKYFRQHYEKQKSKKLPYSIRQGDIVLVDFGINVGHEFSDMFRDKHFALVWAQQGQVFIVIPLTKQPQRTNNKFVVNLGNIPGLPGERDSYARLDSIRSISIRRISRMNEHPEGKITLKDSDVLDKIRNAIRENFLDVVVSVDKL